MPEPLAEFFSFEDLAKGQGELALSLEYNSDTKDLSKAAYAPLPNDTWTDDIAAVRNLLMVPLRALEEVSR